MKAANIIRQTQAKVADYIAEHQMLQPDTRILVAISGGADSVALLYMLRALNYSCTAAHCNFHLRGEESDRDQHFVEELCHQWDVPLQLAHFDTVQYAKSQHISIEMAARDLRYQWFDELLHSHNTADVLATGHHIDDQVETLLLRLMRGTGLKGLCGMQPKRDALIRPLLCLSTKQIRAYLNAVGQTFVTDSSNSDLSIARNKVRHQLIPLMEEFNPSVTITIAEMMEQLHEIDEHYNQCIQAELSGIATDDELRLTMPDGSPTPKPLIYAWLEQWNFNSSQVNDIYRAILRGQTGKQFVSRTGERVFADREKLLRDKALLSDKPGFELQYDIAPLTSDYTFDPNPDIAYMDADLVDSTQWTLRTWQEGDRFVPFGMRGSKTVSDFLTDLKVPLPEKQRQWLLCQGDDIIWVIGKRTDNRYRCHSKTTRVIKITRVAQANERKQSEQDG